MNIHQIKLAKLDYWKKKVGCLKDVKLKIQAKFQWSDFSNSLLNLLKAINICMYIVTCQAHPVLVKIRRIRCAIRSF